MIDAIKHIMLKELTPVQAHSIPILLSKQTLVSIAPTGSGKSLAFLIPLFLLFQENGWKNENKQPSIYNNEKFL